MSNNRSVVIQWGSSVAGREAMGLELFMSVSQYYQQLVSQGNLANFQTVVFENGSVAQSAGLMILTGSKEQITTVTNSERHRENLSKGGHIVNNLVVQGGVTGDAIPERVQELAKWRKELGI